MTGRLWRLMTGSCQSSSHRESRALPSAPKLMGRRQGGEVKWPRVTGWRQRERGKNGGLSVKKSGERRWMEQSRAETKDGVDYLMRWRDEEMANGGGEEL